MQTGPKDERIHYSRRCLSNLSLNQFRVHGYAAFSSRLILDTGLACCDKTAISPQKQLPRPFRMNTKKPLKKYGFLRRNYGFVRFNYGCSKTRFLLNFRKYGFSTGQLRGNYGIITGKDGFCCRNLTFFSQNFQNHHIVPINSTHILHIHDLGNFPGFDLAENLALLHSLAVTLHEWI